MHIVISNTIEAPIYLQIVNQIKAAVLSGELREGEGLPSIRGLAAALKISVITTKRAYEELEKEGFIFSRAGKGSYVAAVSKGFAEQSRQKEVLEHWQEAVRLAKLMGVKKEEVQALLTSCYQEEER